MGSSFSPTARRALGAAAAGITGLALAVGLSGCPVAAELENPDRFDALQKPGGTAGTGNTNCVQPLPDMNDPTIACDYPLFIKTHCARGGCHNPSFHTADLSLSVDPSPPDYPTAGGEYLIARILDVPAKHVDINCPGNVACDPAAPACANCMMCQPVGDFVIDSANVAASWMVQQMDAFNGDNGQGSVPRDPAAPACANCMMCQPVGDFLIDSANFAESWMVKKMDAFNVDNVQETVQMGCGTAMPYTPGNTGFTAMRRDCLRKF